MLRLQRTKGRLARGERACSIRAAIPLPVPLAPSMRTGHGNAASRAMVAFTLCISADWPNRRGPGLLSSPCTDSPAFRLGSTAKTAPSRNEPEADRCYMLRPRDKCRDRGFTVRLVYGVH